SWVVRGNLKGPKADRGDRGDKGNNGEKEHAGITPHIDATTQTWWISPQDTGGLARSTTRDTGHKGDHGEQGPQGPKGDDGITPNINPVTGTWWIGSVDTGVPARGPKGNKGDEGLTPELRKGQDVIEWRYQGTATWTPLIPLVDITGPQG